MPKEDTHTLSFAVAVYKTETSIDIGLFFIYFSVMFLLCVIIILH